jgi:hypothetical protein
MIAGYQQDDIHASFVDIATVQLECVLRIMPASENHRRRTESFPARKTSWSDSVLRRCQLDVTTASGLPIHRTAAARHLFELGRPAGAPGRIALPVAGDDAAAKTVVLKLVEELGFDGVDAGGLDESWRQQPGTPVYTKDFDADGVRRGLYEASKVRTPKWRGTSSSPGSFTAPA